MSQKKFGFPEPDPRIGYFMLDNRKFGSFEGLAEDSRDKVLQMASISEESFPQYFRGSDFLKNASTLKGLHTARDPMEIVLKNNFQASENLYIRIQFKQCN